MNEKKFFSPLIYRSLLKIIGYIGVRRRRIRLNQLSFLSLFSVENLSKNRSSKFARNGMLKKKRKKENRSNQSLLRIYLLRRGRVYVYQMKIKSKVEDKPCPGVGGRGGGEEEGVGIELYRRVAIESRFRVSWPR